MQTVKRLCLGEQFGFRGQAPVVAALVLAMAADAFVPDRKLQAAEAPSAAPSALCVMTFNLRYASPEPPNAWPQRRPVMRACIQKLQPDLIGTQEGLYAQLKDLAADLPAYEWIGLGRDGGSHGEFMAIFYRKERFEPLEFDHFWLSDTPDVVASASWGNTNRRMVTWVKFRDRPAKREFYFWNTHLDHAVQLAREKGAALIRQRVEALNTTLPVLLVGDFNATAGANKAYDVLVSEAGFTDLWTIARQRTNATINSFHAFRGPQPGGQRIDWILARGPVTVAAMEIVTFQQDGQYPSDHFPVVAWLKLGVPGE
jgi:endonuclease/exonuclease/phosphatase family metal-dependent hydrolase